MDNGLNMVIIFDGKEIQMPSTKPNGKTVFVKHEKEKYAVVTKAEYEKSLKVATKKSPARAKKEIIDSEEESEDEK